jgi:NADPH-dependent glutamate synthase beta subunit-like oxidoreductase
MLENVCCHPSEEAVEHLRKAEFDLEQAREKERAVQMEIIEAEAEVKKAIEEIENPRAFPVEVLYDGVKKPFKVRIEEAVKRLLDQAIKAFGPLPNPHTLSLYKDGVELADAQTIQQAGIKPCDVLLLRPSKVKGGV